MTRFIDRRQQNKNKSAVNRQRFIKRYKKQIRSSVSAIVKNRKISDIDAGDSISIPKNDIEEKQIKYDHSGVHNTVLPGNQQFSAGDKIKRPPSMPISTESTASSSGSGEDHFVFQLTREEFLDVFFDDLELPNLVKSQLGKIFRPKSIRSGLSSEGSPTNINLIRSFRNAVGRRIAHKGSLKMKIKESEDALLKANSKEHQDALQKSIEHYQEKMNNIPFIDPIDLKYNRRVTSQKPTSRAVMFCVMDVSGSMDESKKDLAKRFFILLHLFLKKNYEQIEMVFIRHHTYAKEVNEEDFFFSRETGGTVVSSALDLMRDLIQHRYPASEWNIYGAQASDGDNWTNDSPKCRDILIHDIMPVVQFFAYIEIQPRRHQSLWESYKTVQQTNKHFSMQTVKENKDIYPTFREFFKRQHPAIPDTLEESK